MRTTIARLAVTLLLGASFAAIGAGASAADGGLDPSFATNGRLDIDWFGSFSQVEDAIVQPNGKILLIGQGYFENVDDFFVARLRPDGKLDPTFGFTGFVPIDFAEFTYDYAYDAVVQPDGKIVLVGASEGDFALARLKPNGLLDTSFSGDGLVTTPFGTDPSVAKGVAVQSDGKIVVGGTVGVFNGSSYPGDFAVARYNPNGSLDTTYSGDGKTSLSVGTDDDATGMVLQSGKAVVVGTTPRSSGTNADWALARFETDGDPDPTFGTGGFRVTDLGEFERADAVVLDPVGRIIIGGGKAAAGYLDFTLARYTKDGTLDTAFGGGDGWEVSHLGTTGIVSLALQRDGKIVAAGGEEVSGPTPPHRFVVARYGPTGFPDPTWGTAGLVKTAFPTQAIAGAVAIGRDNKIVVAGTGTDDDRSHLFVARYRSGIPPGCVIVGTPGNDVLTGGPGNNFICGLGGNDRLVGRAGRDTLLGGGGRDTLVGGRGRDFLNGGRNRDRCKSGPGKDKLRSCERGR